MESGVWMEDQVWRHVRPGGASEEDSHQATWGEVGLGSAGGWPGGPGEQGTSAVVRASERKCKKNG